MSYNTCMYKSFGIGIGLLLPVVVSADAAAKAVAEAASFVETFNRIILFPTIALLSAVALLVFIFGCFQYIALSGNDQARSQGVKHITWGIVGLVVMLSAFAILSIVTASFGLQDELDCAREPGGCDNVVIPFNSNQQQPGQVVPGNQQQPGQVIQ